MQNRSVKLVDSTGGVLATAKVADDEGIYTGTIDLQGAPPELRALFDEFEEIVNGQMFVFLDDIQARIASRAIKAIFEDGCAAPVRDLQVFPKAGDVSFRLAGICSPTA